MKGGIEYASYVFSIMQEESKEVHIRPRPQISPLVHYEMCKNTSPCPHGLSCTFAHSEEELHNWFQSRVAEEPRQDHPAGVAPEYQMCKNVEESGYCPYDTHCHYPHSKEELDFWKEVARRPPATVHDYISSGAHKHNERYSPMK